MKPLSLDVVVTRGASIESRHRVHAAVVGPGDKLIAVARRRLLAVGRLKDQKGFHMLIDAFAALAQDFPGWELAIVGEGPRRIELERRIALAGLAGVVLLPGFAGAEIVADTGWVVAARDAVSFSNAILETVREMGHPVTWRARCKAARERVVDNFGLDRVVRAYQDVWAASAGSRR